MSQLKLFVVSFVVFILLDMAWLGYFARALYLEQYGAWLNLHQGQLLPIWWASLIVYGLFALALLIFVQPLSQGQLMQAFVYGAAMGFIIYGVYDFTCLAIFKDWPVMMAFIDWAWGTILCGVVATITVYLSRVIS
jgi:uncharacterized membrane protein